MELLIKIGLGLIPVYVYYNGKAGGFSKSSMVVVSLYSLWLFLEISLPLTGIVDHPEWWGDWGLIVTYIIVTTSPFAYLWGVRHHKKIAQARDGDNNV